MAVGMNFSFRGAQSSIPGFAVDRQRRAPNRTFDVSGSGVHGCSFQRDGVRGEEEGVRVEPRGYGCAAELNDPLSWLETPGETNLDDVTPKGALIGDHVDIAGSDVGGTEVVLGDCFVDR